MDDWHYTYIDEKNLRRFLRNVGYLASKQELIAIIRRVDTDGDAKICLEEFNEGVRSQFSLVSPFKTRAKVENPTASFAMRKSSSKSDLKSRSNANTPLKNSKYLKSSAKKKRPSSA